MSEKTIEQQKAELVQNCQPLLEKYKTLYKETDLRLLEYLEECLNNTDKHGLFELLSIPRFLQLTDQYEFCPEEVKLRILIYEILEFASPSGYRSYSLTPCQVFQFANLYGLFKSIEKDERLITEAILFVARKYAKTTQVAGLAATEFLIGDKDSQIFCAANSQEQANIAFDTIGVVLSNLQRRSGGDKDFFRLNRKDFFNELPNCKQRCKCLAADASKLDGLNASFAIIDEYAQATRADLRNVLKSSMGTRKNPLLLVITTASKKKDTPFYDDLQTAKAMLKGEIESIDSHFFHLFTLDDGDDWRDPIAWKKAQPHLGITVREEFYQEEVKAAQNSADRETEVKNKLLNVFEDATLRENWVNLDNVIFTNEDRNRLSNYPCFVSVDLSASGGDFTAVTYTFYIEGRQVNGKDCPYHSFTDYYLPISQQTKSKNKDLYHVWSNKNLINWHKGELVHPQSIATDILYHIDNKAENELYNVQLIGYDRYKAESMVQILEESGIINSKAIIPVPQTSTAFSSMTSAFQFAISEGKLSIEENPITQWMFSNAVLQIDSNENIKPIKKSSDRKIDGLITNIQNFYLISEYLKM